MNKMFTTGIIAGSVLGIAGIMMMTQDRRTQDKIMRSGKKFVSKATDTIEDMTDMFK